MARIGKARKNFVGLGSKVIEWMDGWISRWRDRYRYR
jgi:hypothetical protein